MEHFRTHDGIELAYDEVGAPDGHLAAVNDSAFAAAMVSFFDEHAE